MTDIATLLANAAQTNADFSAIGKLPQAYWQGRDEAFKNEGRDLFREGVPKNPDGSINYGAVRDALFKHGDLPGATSVDNLDVQRQQLKLGQDISSRMGAIEGGGGAPSAASLPPSPSRNGGSVVAPPLGQSAGPQAASARPGGGDQPGSIVGLVSAAGVPEELAGPIIQQVSAIARTDPNVALNPQIAPRVQQIVAEAVRRQQPQQAAPQPQPVAQPNPQQNQGTFGAPSAIATRGAIPTGADPEIQKQIATYTAIASNPAYPKSVQEAAQTRLKALQEQGQPTGPIKEYDLYRRQGGELSFKDFQTEVESSKSGAAERAKGDVKEQQSYIDSGRLAQQRLGTLNTISNIVNSDKNLNLGFGSETTLKVKMALQQAGIDFGDLSGAQLIQKLNGVLASESSKSFSTRPTQFEFQTFLKNNPGLALDEKGNVRMLGILSQTAKREADLGKLARQNRDNWDKWDDVVEKYDREHPIFDPTTGKMLSNHSIIAPAPKSDAPSKNGSQSGPARYGSPGDVHAAIAAGKLKKGDTFTDPNGVNRVVP